MVHSQNGAWSEREIGRTKKGLRELPTAVTVVNV